MPFQPWQSNPDLTENLEISRPHRLDVIYPSETPSNRIYRSASLGGNLNSTLSSPDDYELFYTPRATIKQREKLMIPEIVFNSISPATEVSANTGRSTTSSKHMYTANKQKNSRQFKRFDTTSPFKHRDVRDLLKSAKRRLKRITDDQDVQIFGKNRRDSQGSMSGEARVQFALSQTPPVETMSSGSPPRHHHTNNAANTSTTATHHTLSPVIQCFQKDQ
ncbi:hypothetical protein GCK72_011902 [Caenorhabditis remanei]|uniref:Uncharacterized protein n=1 Tax=Caenorhabditis remanei TaxID=31234 RepID=A0A6A5H8Y2_CAERE|nr:hypothetical protein GCK72_011902 [Caenorhabditis remanei]KAF1763635.1 hypothetical protein GCK72_011902 [Caenorhabditis remanei]